MNKNLEWFWVACRETGSKIASFETIEEAKKQIEQYEKEDKKDGCFSPDFYDIVLEDYSSVQW